MVSSRWAGVILMSMVNLIERHQNFAAWQRKGVSSLISILLLLFAALVSQFFYFTESLDDNYRLNSCLKVEMSPFNKSDAMENANFQNIIDTLYKSELTLV